MGRSGGGRTCGNKQHWRVRVNCIGHRAPCFNHVCVVTSGQYIVYGMAVPRATCAFSARRVGCSDRNTQPGTRKSRLLAVPLQAVLACERLPPRLGFSVGHVARVRQRTGLHGQCCIVFDGSIADAAAAFEWFPGIARLGTNRPAVFVPNGSAGHIVDFDWQKRSLPPSRLATAAHPSHKGRSSACPGHRAC